MKDYLLELGCEEIPARFVPNLLKQLKDTFSGQLDKQRLTYDTIDTFGTYRRLVVCIRGLADMQPDQTKILKGPGIEIGLSPDGSFLPPAVGFAKKCGVSPEHLSRHVENGKTILALFQEEKGQHTKDLLSLSVPEWVRSLTLPIAMKWGTNQGPFIRPIHWILSLLDDEIVPFELFGITSDRFSYGHRLLTDNPEPGQLINGAPIQVPTVDEYIARLSTHHVLVKEDTRRRIIKEYIIDTMQQENPQPDLIEEVVYLTEKPTCLTGQFDSSYLEIPSQVLVECMQKHQRYFPVFHNQAFEAQFIVVADNVNENNKKQIIQGNQSVLKARLDDAHFFWKEDLKHPLSERIEKLKGIVFQKGLGSLFEKKERIKILCDSIAQQLKVPEKERSLIFQTADLCKADLASYMVGEFPSLQGTMGRLLAEKEGLHAEVCLGIEQHYFPKSLESENPTSTVGRIVSLADKLDTIVACFYNGLIPTGSQDPLGIRRAMYGILKMVSEDCHSLNLKILIDKAYELLGPEKKNEAELIRFFTQRARSLILAEVPSYDCVDAVLPFWMVHFKETSSLALALHSTKKSQPDPFKQLVETAVRIKRLAEKKTTTNVTPALFELPIEQETWNQFQDPFQGPFKRALQEKNYLQAIDQLIALCPSITTYFESVLVMDPRLEIQENRLAFLASLHRVFGSIADFEKIVLE